MNRIVYTLGIFFVSLAFCFALVKFSVVLGTEPKKTVTKTSNTFTWSKIRLVEKDNFYTPELTAFEPKDTPLGKNIPVMVEFGRL